MKSKNEQVADIIEYMDKMRLDAHGGYPSDYVIENDKVYWADLDPSKEYLAPLLVIFTVDDFLKEYEGQLKELYLEREVENDHDEQLWQLFLRRFLPGDRKPTVDEIHEAEEAARNWINSQ